MNYNKNIFNKNFITNPVEIERKSFEIIDGLLKDKKPLGKNASIIQRVIHTTADFDYLENLVFSENVLEETINILKHGVNIVTDTQMVRAGVNKRVLEQLKSSVHCFIDSAEVSERAKITETTRSASAMEFAVEHVADPLLFAIGNAPTALIKLYEMITRGYCKPCLIIGVPVGFVNVTESKELIMELNIPFIVSRGRKGGSNVAAAIINAILYETIKYKENTNL
ncbi:MAG: precorrin-8X methylmutase [Planctomycetaceae bacterium]|jgi:precorrin-8X/cobalt-precorrin-8 methylmutase|nr:precorrin-8X methylmutase [Planctomycetaceae bacterium]